MLYEVITRKSYRQTCLSINTLMIKLSSNPVNPYFRRKAPASTKIVTTDYFPFAMPLMNWTEWRVWSSMLILGGLVYSALKFRKPYKTYWFSFLYVIA